MGRNARLWGVDLGAGQRSEGKGRAGVIRDAEQPCRKRTSSGAEQGVDVQKDAGRNGPDVASLCSSWVAGQGIAAGRAKQSPGLTARNGFKRSEGVARRELQALSAPGFLLLLLAPR